MKTNHQQIYQILVFVSCLLSASWTQAATVFNLSFFDQNNAQVGSGQFSVDFGREICVETFGPPGGCSSPFPYLPDLTFVKNPITDFSANLLGESWPRGAYGKRWWADAALGSGHQYNGRGGIGIAGNWYFGDLVFYRALLQMHFQAANDISGNGTWSQTITTDTLNPSFGTWTATATPIPAAAWLFASGLGALGVFKRKKAKS